MVVGQRTKAFYGERSLKVVDTSKNGAKTPYKKWQCKVDTCEFVCRIRLDTATGLRQAETTDAKHNHEVARQGLDNAANADVVESTSTAWGLPLEFKNHILTTIATLKSFNVDPAPMILKRALQKEFPNHPLCHRSKDNRLQGKVASYFARLNSNKRGGMNNVGDLGRYKNANRLQIPNSLEPTTSYQSPEDIAVALGLERSDVAKPLVLMPPDDMIQEFQDLYGDSDNSMSTSVFIVTPASLSTLLDVLTNIPDGFRLAYVDGSRNFVLENGAAFMPIGTHDVSYREHSYEMSQSLRPFAYALVPGERIKILACFLRLISILSKKLFGVDFQPDFGGLDHSAAFAGGFTKEFGDQIKLLLCFFHAMQIIEDKHKDRPYGKIVRINSQRLHS